MQGSEKLILTSQLHGNTCISLQFSGAEIHKFNSEIFHAYMDTSLF